MLLYLFFLAAVATTPAPELPEIELTSDETQALQQIVAVLEKENVAVVAEIPEITLTTVAEAPQPITITNSIQPNMLEYKHWTGKYSPEQFAISINGVEIKSGETCELPACSKTVEIGYTYSFMNGMKSGGRKISYELNENIAQASITFNWKDDWRVIVDNGKAVKEIV